jgi:hypothetical protein
VRGDVRPHVLLRIVDAAADVMRRFFVPALAACPSLDASSVAPALSPFKGHRMAKAALEVAVLDAELRAAGRTLARELGATRDRVPCGASVVNSIGELLDAVGAYLDAGYVRIKLKIEPGWDVEPVSAVRERFGTDVLLQVDGSVTGPVSQCRNDSHSGMPVMAMKNSTIAGTFSQNQFMLLRQVFEVFLDTERVQRGARPSMSAG